MLILKPRRRQLVYKEIHRGCDAVRQIPENYF